MERSQLEKLSRDYQVLQEQLQSVALQKEQFTAQREEFKEAAAEIEKSTGKVYLSIGGALVESQKEQALKGLKEKQESAEMRLTIVNKQYDELSKREQSMRSEINNALKELKK